MLGFCPASSMVSKKGGLHMQNANGGSLGPAETGMTGSMRVRCYLSNFSSTSSVCRNDWRTDDSVEHERRSTLLALHPGIPELGEAAQGAAERLHAAVMHKQPDGSTRCSDPSVRRAKAQLASTSFASCGLAATFIRAASRAASVTSVPTMCLK